MHMSIEEMEYHGWYPGTVFRRALGLLRERRRIELDDGAIPRELSFSAIARTSGVRSHHTVHEWFQRYVQGKGLPRAPMKRGPHPKLTPYQEAVAVGYMLFEALHIGGLHRLQVASFIKCSFDVELEISSVSRLARRNHLSYLKGHGGLQLVILQT